MFIGKDSCKALTKINVPYTKYLWFSYLSVTKFQTGFLFVCLIVDAMQSWQMIFFILSPFCELILINSPMQLLWQTGSETVFGIKNKSSSLTGLRSWN